MSDIGRITPAGAWVAAAAEMTIPESVKGIFIKSGGSITIEDRAGTALTIAASADSVWPLRPSAVTAASNAYLLF